MNNKIIKVFIFITSILSFSAIEEGVIAAITIDRIVAVVNNEVITQSEMEELLQKPRKAIMENFSGDEQERLLKKLTKEILDKMIEKKLQLQVAKQRNITVSPKDVEAALDDIKKKNAFPDDEAFKQALASENLTLEQYRKEVTDQLIIMRLVNTEVQSSIVISEEDIRTYYKENIEEFTDMEEVRLRIILLKEDNGKAKERAADVLNQIKMGADFAEMARNYSEDPTSRDGGDIGFFKKGQILAELEDKAFSIKKGDVSDIIKAPKGYYIIRVEDRREAVQIPVEKVRDDIQKKLYEEKSGSLYDEWLNDLRKDSYVEIKLK